MSPAILRFSKYTIIGTSTFLIDLLLLFILVEGFGLVQFIAAGIAFVIAVSMNYVISRRFVFVGTLRSVGAGYLNFIAIALTGLGLVMGGMYIMTVVLSWNYLLARTTIAAVTGFWNYLINLYVNFKVAGK